MQVADAHEHKLKPNAPRIIAAIFRTIDRAQRQRRRLTQYDIVKTLFLADREHLNEWGRPVTFDNYFAMKHGPVPSLAYDFLKGNEFKLRKYEVSDLPWRAHPVDGKSGQKNFEIIDEEFDVEDSLSESDLEAIDHALSDVLRLGFSQVRRLTHEDPAYLEAWRDDGGQAAYEMKLGLLFETPNYEQAELISEQSEYV